MPNHEFTVVTTTHDTEDSANSLAAAAVHERLAACAQIYPVNSVYWWNGELQTTPEWRIDFKTRADLATRLGTFITDHHTYDTPEVIAVPIREGNPAYLDWLATETTP